LKVDAGALPARAETMRRADETVMFVVADGRIAGLIGVADPVKTNATQAIQQLPEARLRVAMLTVDSKTTAEAVGRSLGMDEVIAGVLPDQKALQRVSLSLRAG
jgi:Cu+-exporting ATPase